ncbi:MAG: phosphotransferase [Proteobacteria bacterium]|nr:phosphotransferase [Pseudomonadota bacterium]
MTNIPVSLDEVDADWLHVALAGRGHIPAGRLTHFDQEVIGEGAGFLGDVVRITPYVEDGEGHPESFILKIPTASDNRRIGQLIGVYEREIRFYEELRPHMPIRTPRCYYSAMDATDPRQAIKMLETLNRIPVWLVKLMLPLAAFAAGRTRSRYVLLMEDISQFRVGDQVAGCSTGEAERALTALAQFHAAFYANQEAMADYPWAIPLDLGARFTRILAEQTGDLFRDAHTHWMSADNVAVLDWMEDHGLELLGQVSKLPYTLLHGDYRLDNVCFDDATGEVVVFDWQMVISGPVGLDLAYFISSSMGPGTSEDDINHLLGHYAASLAAAGVSLSAQRIRYEYETGLISTLSRLVLMASQELSFGEDRGVELMQTWLTRVFHRVDQIDLDGVLGDIPD